MVKIENFTKELVNNKMKLIVEIDDVFYSEEELKKTLAIALKNLINKSNKVNSFLDGSGQTPIDYLNEENIIDEVKRILNL